MSDLRLRQLEREAHADPQVEVMLLRVRMRGGDISRERVELAAYCGSSVAQRALGNEWPPAPVAWWDPKSCYWLSGLKQWGNAAQIRAAVAAGWVALEAWEAEPRGFTDWADLGYPGWHDYSKHPRSALDAIGAGDREKCKQLLVSFAGHSFLMREEWFMVPLAHAATVGQCRIDPARGPISAARLTSEAVVREAICVALIKWALA